MPKNEYKYGLSYNRADKNYGNGEEVHVTVRGDVFADVVKEMKIAKKKALAFLSAKPAATENQDSAVSDASKEDDKSNQN